MKYKLPFLVITKTREQIQANFDTLDFVSYDQERSPQIGNGFQTFLVKKTGAEFLATYLVGMSAEFGLIILLYLRRR